MDTIKAYIESYGLKKEDFIDLKVNDEKHNKLGVIIDVENCDKKGFFIATMDINSEFLNKCEGLMVTPPQALTSISIIS